MRHPHNDLSDRLALDHGHIADLGGGWLGAHDPLANFHGGAGDDTYAGGNNPDSISGGGGDDTLSGGGGNDTIDGGAGNDVLDGGLGLDTVSYDSAKAGVVVDLNVSGAQDTGGAGVDRLTGFENILGSAHDDRLTGTTDANTIEGGAGDDTLVGGGGTDTASYAHASAGVIVDLNLTTAQHTSGAGIDTLSGFENLIGSAFNDTLVGTAGDNVLDDGAGIDTVSYAAATIGVTVSLALQGAAQSTGAGADTLIGVENLVGSAHNDHLIGDGGDNVLDGGLGVDTLEGGAGNDLYIVRNASDVVQEATGAGTDLIESTLYDITLPGGVENLTLISGAENGTGNALNNAITGNAQANYLFGGDGDDTITGGDGNDGLVGGTGNNLLIGGNGNDTLNGSQGLDTLIGGSGNDHYYIFSTDVIVENPGEGIDTISVTGSFTLPENIENLQVSGGNGTGNELDNLISTVSNGVLLSGLGGDDKINVDNGHHCTLDGGAGADIMTSYDIRSEGYNTFIIDNVGDVIADDDAHSLYDVALSSVSYILSSSYFGSLVLTGDQDLSATGNNLVNNITGNGGDNTLDGAGGADTLIGGDGNDTYIVDSLDTIEESAGQGTDTVVASFNYTLGANLENLRLTGSVGLSGIGNALDNLINGTDQNDTLDGAGGADTLAGGLGDDTYLVDGTQDQIVEAVNGGTDTVRSSVSYTLGANLEDLVLTGSSPLKGEGNELANAITANDAAATLVGGGGDDTLIGGAGDDSLVGGTGFDSMSGGMGNDLYVVDSAQDVVVEQANAGTDTIVASISYTLEDNVEILRFIGSGDLDGTGNASDDTIYGTSGDNHLSGLGGSDSLHAGGGSDSLDGGSGADTLNGGLGADTMFGAAGNDTYIVDNPGDVVSEFAYGGTDRVESSISYTLTANVENLQLTGSGAIDGTGNDLDNTIKGNAKANVLDGEGGDDVLNGGAGRDTASYQDAPGAVSVNLQLTGAQDTGSGGSDTLVSIENLTGSAFDDVLHGNTGVNVLVGGAGDDTLHGGRGGDILTGGDGADAFTFQAVLDSTRKAPDTITDLTNQDRIDLSLVDADTTQAGNQAFHIVSAFDHHAGELVITYDSVHDVTRFEGDVDGDKRADIVILATGDHTDFSGLVL